MSHGTNMTGLPVWPDYFISVIYIVHTCEMAWLYVWHSWVVCVTWLIRICDKTHSYSLYLIQAGRYTTCPIHMCDMTYSYVWHDLSWWVIRERIKAHASYDAYDFGCLYHLEFSEAVFQISWTHYVISVTWHMSRLYRSAACKSHHDAAPPTRAFVCYRVLPCATELTHDTCATAFLQPSRACCRRAACRCIAAACLICRCRSLYQNKNSETSWRTWDYANIQPCGQDVNHFRAQSRAVLHEASKSLYCSDLGWFGGQLGPPLLALAFLALQPMTEPSTPLERDAHPLLALNSQRSINSSISRFSSSQMWTTRVSLLRVFFFLLFFSKKKVLLCLSCGRWRISQTLGPHCPRDLTIT